MFRSRQMCRTGFVPMPVCRRPGFGSWPRWIVTLSGYVVSNDQRAATVQDASQVKDVRLVIDNLRVVEAQTQEVQPLAPQAQEPQAHEPRNRAQNPDSRNPASKSVVATQKPSAGVTRYGITRSVKSTAGQPPETIVLKSDPARATRPVTPEHLPARKRSRLVPRQSLQPLRPLPPFRLHRRGMPLLPRFLPRVLASYR